MNPTTQVAVKQPTDFLGMLSHKDANAQIASVLPKYLPVERFKRICRTAFLNNEFLQKCEPVSIMLAVMKLAAIGLEPDGRKAHLVPFKDKCMPLPGFMGYIARAQENGLRGIHYDNVHYNDVFEWEMHGYGLHYKHVLDLRKPDRGEYFASYCIWKEAKDDTLHGVIMSKTEIDKIRSGSPAANSGPWVSHYAEMCRKTIIRRAQKQWPLDVELSDLEANAKVVGTIDIDTLPVAEVAPEPPAPTALAGPAGASESKQKPAEQEAARQSIHRQLERSAVTFNAFVAYVETHNICELGPEAQAWENLDAVPDAIFAALADEKNPKLLANLLKKK